MSPESVWTIALAAASTQVLPGGPHRRVASLGLLAVAFGLASAAVAGVGDPALAAAGSVTRAIDAGFVIAGELSVIWAGMRVWPAPDPAAPFRARARFAAPILVLLAMLLGWQARGLLVSGGTGAAAAASTLLLLGAGLRRLVDLAFHRSSEPIQPAAPAAAIRPRSRRGAIRCVALGFGALLAISAPNAWLVIGGALLAAGAASPVLLVVASAGLLPSLWFMRTVAGPVGLRMATLDSVPFSGAAESLLAPVLALGAIGLFGLWPLSRWRTALLVPVGVAVMLRLGGAIPAGVASWETVLVPIGVIALVHALIAADAGEALAAGAWLASATGARAAAVLLAAAAVLALAGSRMRQRWPASACWVAGMTGGVAAAGAVRALHSLLGAEVVYAVMCLVIVAALLARMEPPRERPAQSRR